jgi:hypothetical protein
VQIAPYMVAGLVENTLVSVFFEFQQKTTIYRRKFVKRCQGLSQRTLDREIDASLRNQIAQQTLHVCERHFEKTQPKHVHYFLSLVEVLIFWYETLESYNLAEVLYIFHVSNDQICINHMEQEKYKY